MAGRAAFRGRTKEVVRRPSESPPMKIRMLAGEGVGELCSKATRFGA